MQKIFFSILILSFLIVGIGPIGILSGSCGVKVLAQNDELPSPGITPDSPFYFLKSWRESIQTFFTFGAENKAKQFLHLAEVRLAEHQKMVEKGKIEIAQSTLEKYERQLNQALEKTKEAKEKGKDVEKLVTLISEKTLKHQEVLLEIYEKVPEQAKTAIKKAIEVSKKGFEEAAEAVSGVKKQELQKKAEEIKIKVETADWKTYRNEKHGYSFKYPPDCFYGAMLPYCKQSPPEERPTECLCFLDGGNPDSIFLQAFTGPKDKLILATFSVSYYNTPFYNPPPGTDLIGWIKKRFASYGNMTIPDKPNFELDGVQTIRTYSPASPMAPSDEGIYFIRNSKLLEISMLSGDNESNKKLYNQILSTFKFIELEKAGEEAPKIEEVPQVEEKPTAPGTPALKAPVLTDPGISVKKHEAFTLNWTSVKEAKRYWLQRDTSTNFSIPPWSSEVNSATDNPGIGTSAPEVTTTYYYRIKACDDQRCSAWSNVVDMRVIVPVIVPSITVPSITVTSPNGGEKFDQGANLTITWDSKGVDYVDIDLQDWGRKQEDGSTPFILDLANNYSASKGTYTWKIYSDWPTGNLYKIKAESSDGLIKDTSDNYFSIVSLSPTCPVPEAPVVSAKPTGPVNWGAEYSINWSIVAGASHYIVQKDTDLAFSNPSVIYSGSLWHTKKESHSPSVSTVYWYKARAENGCGVGPWSNIVGIQVKVPAVPGTPVLTDPGISVKEHEAFTLNWTSVSGATSYILRRDTNSSFSNPVTVYSGPLNSFSGDLSPSVSTTYYFRVEACNNDGCSSGSNVVDMQVIVPSITVTSPNGGETLKPGETIRITWSSVGVDSVRIKLFYLSQAMYDMTKNAPVPAASGYYDAIIPSIESGRGGDYYKIGIFDASNAAIIDHSNNYFSIVVPSVTVLSPNGGETWTIGQTKRVSWSSTGVNYVRIYIYDESIAGSGSTNYIYDGAIPASTGYYDWTIQKGQLPGSTLGFPRNYKIIVYGLNEAALGSAIIVWDQSDSYFSIVEGAVGLENIRNQLASVSEVISRLMENVKKLMAGSIGIPMGVKVLAQKAVLQTGCGKIECVKKSDHFYDKYGPANWTDAGAQCICQYYTPEEWKLTYCALTLGPPTEKELQIWRDCGVPVPGGPVGSPPSEVFLPEIYEIHEPANLTQVTFLNYCSDPDWSPDGSQIIFERQKEDDRGIYLINVDGTGLTKIGLGYNPSWSPVDNKIIYRGDDPWRSLFLIDLDKGWESKVKLVNQINEQGSWSPDGKKIVYSSPNGSKYSSIWVMNSDGSGKIRLTTDEDGYCMAPSFSYDGSKIAYLKGFASYAVGGETVEPNEIWAMNSDGSNKHMIYAPGDSVQLIFQRAWNKNNKIIFMRTWYRQTGKAPQVWVINSDGSDPRVVAAGPAVYGDPVWDNSGTKVAISKSSLQSIIPIPGDIWKFSYEEPAEKTIEKPEGEVEESPKNIFQKIWEVILNFFKRIFRIK